MPPKVLTGKKFTKPSALVNKEPQRRKGKPVNLPPLQAETNTTILVCVNETCQGLIPESSYFCPYCGTSVLDNILVKTHTTADYDPTSRLLKPWREQVSLPPRVPAKETNFSITEAWKPAMRTGASTNGTALLYKIKGRNKGRRNLLMGRRRKKTQSGDKENSIETIEEELPEGVVRFKGLKFKKAGHDLDKSNNHNLGVISDASEPQQQPVEEVKENTEQNYYPLGVYLFDIITNMNVYIHVSLYEVVKYSSNTTSDQSLRNCRWIRVGYTVEDEEDEEGGQDLKTLVYLPNQIARAILSLNLNYVDLAAISPKEYYMTNYLQNIYRNLCNRVHVTLPDRPNLCDQWCLLQSPEEKYPGNAAMARMDIVACSELPIPSNDEHESIRFNSVITQVTIYARIGDYFEDRKVGLTARLEVEYQPPEEVIEIFERNDIPSSAENLDVQPIYVTKLHFHISPCYYKYPIKPKKLTFTKKALSSMLEISEEEIDVVLSGEMKMINNFCRIVLLENIRFGHTTRGVRMFVNGVDEDTQYMSVTDVENYYRSLEIIETFLINTIYTVRKEKMRIAAERLIIENVRKGKAILVLQRFIRCSIAKQRVALLSMQKLSKAGRGHKAAANRKMQSLAMRKVNMILTLYSEFRGVKCTVAGKFFKTDDGVWHLLVHAEEGHRRRGISEYSQQKAALAEERGWPINAQAIIDEDHLRWMCGNIEELVGQDLVNMDALLQNRLYRTIIFHSLPNHIDVLTSYEKGKMAVKPLKFLEL